MTSGAPRGRYALYGVIGSGGMARVHIARRFGDGGFRSTVAIKRLAPFLHGTTEAIEMLADEARIASVVSHANVVAMHDVVVHEGELFLVMEHVLGASLLQLVKSVLANGARMPPEIARAVMVGVLRGLHAAHEAKDDRGRLLGVIHRDVSPSNILVGVDGVPRLVDFGIAKADDRATRTRVGERKGKLGFMSPEQLDGAALDRRSDVYSLGVVFWEALVHTRLYGGTTEEEVRARVLQGNVAPPSSRAPAATADDDAIVLRALRRDRNERFATAAEMADAIEATSAIAPQSAVAAFVKETARAEIHAQHAFVDEMNRAEPIAWIGVSTPAAPSRRDDARSEDAAAAGSAVPVASARPPARSRSRDSGLAAYAFAGSGALLVVVAVVIVMTRRSAESPLATTPPPQARPSDSAATAAPLVPGASAVASSVVALDASAPPVASSRRAGSGGRTRVVTTTRPGCNPPYVVDAHGLKIFKEACFE